MKISEDAEIVGLGLHLKKMNVLVLGDIHIGYEENLNRQGVLIPRHHFRDITRNVKEIFRRIGTEKRKLGTVVINGDLKHEFGRISSQEWRDILRFLDLLYENCEEVFLIRGNHDIFLGPVAGKRGIKVADNYCRGGVFICHGHEIPSSKEYKESGLLVIGNEHPAVSVKDNARTETFKCFLKGRFRGKI